MNNRIFKGAINGVEYDSIDAYNKALEEAIKTGGDLHCQQSYTIAQGDPVAPKGRVFNPDEEGYDKLVCEHNMLPEFDLDTLNGIKDHDTNLIRAFDNRLSAANIDDSIQLMKKHGFIKEYKADVEDIFRGVVEDLKHNELAKSRIHEQLATTADEIGKVEAQLDTLRKQQDEQETSLRVCESAEEILKIANGYYRELWRCLNDSPGLRKGTSVRSRIVKPENASPQEGMHLESKEKVGVVTHPFQLNQEQLDAARRLCREIFGPFFA